MHTRLSVIVGAAAVLLVSCKPSDVLNVPPPATQFGTGTPQNAHDAEIAFNGAKVTLFQALDGSAPPGSLLLFVGVLTDEFRASGGYLVTDARFTSADVFSDGEVGDGALQSLYNSRSSLLLAENALRRYEPNSSQWKVGEAFALVGYIELFMAEDYCAGMTLSYVPDGGGIIYGTPLTTDSLLAIAQAHFDSALAHAHGNVVVQSLASVGLARAQLNRAHDALAAAAVAGVPTDFVYNGELDPSAGGAGDINLYADLTTGYQTGCAYITVADREGTTGLNFLSANDPRLILDATIMENCDGRQFGLADSLFYYPTKFGNPATGLIPMATGVEARLIEAEAALATNATGTWATDLNALRAAAPNTYLGLAAAVPSLTTDSTTAASTAMQVDVMFRERAFWLFGTGTRLGDLRRLIRQYHRDPRTVFPTGPYMYNDPSRSPIQSYGTDVSLTLPTARGSVTVTNPYYKGCLSSAGTA